MNHQKRASTEPEPTTLDVCFIIALLFVVACCFVFLWLDLRESVIREIVARLALAYVR